jgi:hypothetical protein
VLVFFNFLLSLFFVVERDMSTIEELLGRKIAVPVYKIEIAT